MDETQTTSPSAADKRPRTIRAFVGALIGAALGGLAGYLIDAQLADEPYAGVRIGSFLGALVGGQIGVGAGVLGTAAMLGMVICSAIGVVAPMLAFWLWRPVPMDHWLPIVASCLGGIVGAMVGLSLCVVVLDPRRRRDS